MSKKIAVGEIVSQLFSGNDEQVKKAISVIQENPSLDYILPLMALFFETNEGEFKEELR